MNTLKTLIDKLDPTARDILEHAVSYCFKRGHHHVEISHWLWALFHTLQPELREILQDNHIDINRVSRSINHSLEQYHTGNTKPPAISPDITTLMNESWLTVSLAFGGVEITTLMLLHTLIHDKTLKLILNTLSPDLAKLDPDILKTHIIQQVKHTDQPINPPTQTAENALQQYAVNLNEQAKAGKIDQVIGREREIKQTIDILSRRRQNNAILTGEPGVGKTAIVEGLALRIINQDVPDALKAVQIYALDLGLLQAGASIKGEFENRLKSLITEIKQSAKPIILFIDEAHTLIGSGGVAGQNDAANLLKPALARGELRSIAATTWDEYKKYFEKDPALTRRFQVVTINEPDTESAIRMVRSLAPSLEKHHGVHIDEAAIKQSVELSQRYIHGRLLPDKAISILDTACARVSSNLTTTPTEIELLDQLLDQLTLEKNRQQQEYNMGIAQETDSDTVEKHIQSATASKNTLVTQWQKEKIIVSDIIKAYSLINTENMTDEKKQQLARLNAQLAKIQHPFPMIKARVDGQTIAHVISDWTGIPVGNMLENEAQTLLKLETLVGQDVVGQDQALHQISDTIQSAATHLSSPEKPYGAFLLTGPSGVGKTETALSLAEHLYGSRENLTVINMSEFKEAHKVSMLAGSPPGYVGYGEGGVLTEAVRRQPYSLILLDEMEKAHSSIQDVFYQVFDKGIIKDGQGRDISFKHTTIIMTSNACSEFISMQDPETLAQSIHPDFQKALHAQLLSTFKPAFLGRLTVVPYMPLSDAILKDILTLKLDKIQQRIIAEYDIQVKIRHSVKQHLLTLCNQSDIGARQIDNLITQFVLPLISTQILKQISAGETLHNLTLNYSQKSGLTLLGGKIVKGTQRCQKIN